MSKLLLITSLSIVYITVHYVFKVSNNLEVHSMINNKS